MFVINIRYIQSLEEINKHLEEHRAFLEVGYKKNYFITSGPKSPRDGGIIISQLTDRKQLEDFIKDDPFLVHNLAVYEITEFTPVKYHKDFSIFVV